MYYRTGTCTVRRYVRASFSPEILHAGAVKGLILLLPAWHFNSAVV